LKSIQKSNGTSKVKFIFDLLLSSVSLSAAPELVYPKSLYTRSYSFLDSPIPWRVTSNKDLLHFRIQHWPNKNIFDVESTTGLHFIIHPTDELPSDSSIHFRQHLHHTLVEISPQQTLISDELKQMSFERRNCYLGDEKSLELFKVYSKQNCEHECQTAAFAKLCGCVPFYLLS
jgi:Amiloride-sensitive sodium channel